MRVFAACAAFLLVLGACARDGAQLRPGAATEADVRRDMGVPSAVVTRHDGARHLVYARGPLGEQTFMVHLRPDGLVERVEQVLDEAHFEKIVPGRTTREELEALLGPPGWVLPDRRRNRTWRTYRFSDAWGYTAEFTASLDQHGLVVEKVIVRLDRDGMFLD